MYFAETILSSAHPLAQPVFAVTPMASRPMKLRLRNSGNIGPPQSTKKDGPSTAEIMAEIVQDLRSPAELAGMQLDRLGADTANNSLTALLADLTPSKLPPSGLFAEGNPFHNAFATVAPAKPELSPPKPKSRKVHSVPVLTLEGAHAGPQVCVCVYVWAIGSISVSVVVYITSTCIFVRLFLVVHDGV